MIKRTAAAMLAVAAGVLCAVATVPRPAAAATVHTTICSKNATYEYDILGDNAASLRAKLTNLANFGPSGKYGDYAYSFTNIGTTLTEATLRADSCDIYFSGYESDSDYTTTELQALRDWTTNDRTRQVVAGCDDSDDDPVCDALGFTVTTDTDTYGLLSARTVNPINCDGSLSPTDQINMAGGIGGYFSGSAVTTTNTLADHETGGAADPAKPVIIYTGNYFLTADINMIESGGTEETVTDGPDVTSNNDIVVMNAFSALADAAAGKAVCNSAAPPTTVAPTTTATTTTAAPTTTLTRTIAPTTTRTATTTAAPTRTTTPTPATSTTGTSGVAYSSGNNSPDPGTTTAGQLPNTGNDTGPIALTGALLLLGGTALIGLSRRRRHI